MSKKVLDFVKVYKTPDGQFSSSPFSWEKQEDGRHKMIDNTPHLDEKGRQVLAPVNRKARRAQKSNTWKGTKWG